jgi:undecaprenyl-phosphate galactose phosphotransferase
MSQNNKRISPHKRELLSRVILFLFDVIGIVISLCLGYLIANILNNITDYSDHKFLNSIFGLIPIYIIVPIIFLYEGIYTHRYDFWEESKLIIKALFFSMVIVFAYLALSKTIGEYSRSVILFSFFSMVFVIPAIKNILKKKLYDFGLWKVGVKVLSDDNELINEIFNNPYLGYIKSKRETFDSVFIDSKDVNRKDINEKLEYYIASKNKVMFIPVFNNHQFNSSDIFTLTNVRTNLIVLQNKLQSKSRMFVNQAYNYTLAILLLPILLPIISIIMILIKRDSKGPALFKQKRLGQNGKEFLVYKFRTMYVDGDRLLKEYLKKNPHEVENYNIYCKYDNDPRITKIGHFLRKTSADELAQIFNVLKGEMNFVGPRPYLVTESDKIGAANQEIILKTKPGITGLWQVSGRNELTFEERIELDKWYVRNWSLWSDIVILFKTVKVVLNKAGAK